MGVYIKEVNAECATGKDGIIQAGNKECLRWNDNNINIRCHRFQNLIAVADF